MAAKSKGKPSPVARWFKREFWGGRLLFNIIFYGGHAGLFAYGWYKQANDPRLAPLNTLSYSVWISRGAGLCLGVDGLLIILPMLRHIIRLLRQNSSILAFLDDNIWFHRQVAFVMLFFTVVHTSAHYVNMFHIETRQLRKEGAWHILFAEPGGLTGHVMLFIMFLMYTTAREKVRKQCFEAFWYTHHLAFFFLLGLYTHATGCFVRGGLPGEPTKCLGYFSWHWTIGGGILYFMERMWREFSGRRETKLVGVHLHPASNTMELRIEKPSFSFRAGQWMFINVPEVSKFQWHPFTISSAPGDPYVSCHIAIVGDFTEQLSHRLSCSIPFEGKRAQLSTFTGSTFGGTPFVDVTKIIRNSSGLPKIRIDGPFGHAASDVFQFDAAVLIGAGTGVTPFASILKHILHFQRSYHLSKLKRLDFVWQCKQPDRFEWFETLLRDLEEEQAKINPDFLKIHLFLTGGGGLEQDTDDDNDGASQVGSLAASTILSRLQSGHPNFRAIFARVQRALDEDNRLPARVQERPVSKVRVHFCGPGGLSKKIKPIALSSSTPTCQFSYAKERCVSVLTRLLQ
ncbi:NADPH oxidase [Meredithblackwellia eburnea MCA 4105]